MTLSSMLCIPVYALYLLARTKGTITEASCTRARVHRRN